MKRRAAVRLIELWQARGADPRFHPTNRCRDPRRSTMALVLLPRLRRVGEIDLRTVGRHPGASVESLIPDLSCKRCSPHLPFAKLTGLR